MHGADHPGVRALHARSKRALLFIRAGTSVGSNSEPELVSPVPPNSTRRKRNCVRLVTSVLFAAVTAGIVGYWNTAETVTCSGFGPTHRITEFGWPLAHERHYSGYSGQYPTRWERRDGPSGYVSLAPTEFVRRGEGPRVERSESGRERNIVFGLVLVLLVGAVPWADSRRAPREPVDLDPASR